MNTTRYDPSTRIVPCEYEGCEQTMTVGDSYSFVITFATTGPTHIAALGCPAEQHFACCPEHAAALAQACITQHLIPAHAERAQAVTDAQMAALMAPERAKAGEGGPL